MLIFLGRSFFYSQMGRLQIAVHDGSFHADDVFAVSVLRLIYTDATVIRTRDIDLLKKADFRLDVGGAYNALTGDFDHHQIDFNEVRENGIPYASAGLIWKHYGPKLSLNEKQVTILDEKIFQLIDANDSGYTLPYDETDLRPYTVSRVVESFNPTWDEKKPDVDSAFFAACKVATQLILNEIKKVRGRDKARKVVEEALRDSSGLPYVVLEANVPWQDVIVDRSTAVYVIHPGSNGDWRVRAVPVRKGGFELRKPLPIDWAGKRDEELALLTGVKDAKFCHKERFMAVTATREGAEVLAMKALDN